MEKEIRFKVQGSPIMEGLYTDGTISYETSLNIDVEEFWSAEDQRDLCDPGEHVEVKDYYSFYLNDLLASGLSIEIFPMTEITITP